jgi:type III secretion protein L
VATGKVIKGDGAAEPSNDTTAPALRAARPASVINADVYQAHQSAHSIVEEARSQAAEIVEAAHREKERIISEAREAARQEGLALTAGQLLRASVAHREIVGRAEQDIVALALEVAEKIIGKDLERDPSVVAEICATAIDKVRASHQVVVRVHPNDAPLLRQLRDRVMERAGRVKEIRFKEDTDVAPGGCMIETDGGVIDAQLATQLEVLREVLMAEVERKGEA